MRKDQFNAWQRAKKEFEALTARKQEPRRKKCPKCGEAVMFVMGTECCTKNGCDWMTTTSKQEPQAQAEPFPKITSISDDVFAVTVGDCLAYGDERVAVAIAKKDAALDACVGVRSKVEAAYNDALEKYGANNVLTQDLGDVLDAITKAKEARK